MKTELYKDITTEKLMTFNEVKEEYAEANGSDLPIDDDGVYVTTVVIHIPILSKEMQTELRFTKKWIALIEQIY